MMERGQERLAEAMLRPINPAAIILLGVFTLIWGLWVGNPFWEVFPTAKMFSFMSLAPEAVWGVMALSAGTIISHGAITRKPGALILGAQTGGFFWLLVSLMYFVGDWMNTGGIMTLLLSVYSMFIYLNLKVNIKHVERKEDLFA